MRLESVERIAAALNDAEVPFIVVGGLAVVAHGYGRQTNDLDVVIRLQPAPIRAAFRALSALGYLPLVPVSAEDFADPHHREGLVLEKGMQVLSFHSDEHRQTPVDVFAREPFDFDGEYAAALVQEIAPGVQVHIISREALLVMKREAGRAVDLADIAELESANG